LQVIGTAGVVGYLSFRSGKQAVEGLAYQSMDQAGDRVHLYLSESLKIPYIINALNAEALQNGRLNVRNLPQLERHLFAEISQFPTVSSILFGTPNGDFRVLHRNDLLADRLEQGVSNPAVPGQVKVYVLDEMGRPVQSAETLSSFFVVDRPWYQKAVATGKPGWSDVFQIGRDPLLAISAYYPVYEPGNQRLLGVFSVNVSLLKISEFLRDIKVSPSAKIFVMDHQGLLLASSANEEPFSVQTSRSGIQQLHRIKPQNSQDPTIATVSRDLAQRFGNLGQLPEGIQNYTYKHQGTAYLIRVQPFRDSYGLNWTTVMIVPESDFTAGIYQNVLYTTYSCGAILLGAILLGIFMTHRLTQPILKLKAAAQAFSQGNFETKVSTPSIGELGELAQCFNEMIDRRKEAEAILTNYNQTLKAQVTQQTATLRKREERYRLVAQKLQQSQHNLKQSQQLYQSLIEVLPHNLFRMDLDQKFTFGNPAFLKLLSVKLHDLMGKTAYDFYSPEVADRYTMQNETVLRTGQLVDLIQEYQAPTADTSCYVRMIQAPVQDESGKIIGIQGIFWDITEHIETVRELEAAKAIAESANQAKSEFLANMSHEIRTPMTAVLGFTDLLLVTPLNSQQRRFLDTINRNGEALLNIINDILDLSKLEAGELELVSEIFNLNSFCQSLQDTFETQIREKHLKFIFEIDPTIPKQIIGPENRLNQVLVNLIRNAIKFTDQGSITLRILGPQKASAPLPDRPRTFLTFEVEDTGIGIALADQDKLFQPFSQIQSNSNRKYKGTGLGLSICKKIVTLMGGEIGLESLLGKGSLFWFTIPLQIPTATDFSSQNLSGAEASPSGGSLPPKAAGSIELPPLTSPSSPPSTPTTERLTQRFKLLIAEDDPNNGPLFMFMLQKLGYQADLVTNGQQALDRLMTECYDIVLMDCQMPIMDGYETTQLLRKQEGTTRHTIVIGLTGFAMTGDEDKCLKSGMDDYLAKPVKLRQLSDTLLRWVKHLSEL
jgi:PAS domain S-box-containing protein